MKSVILTLALLVAPAMAQSVIYKTPKPVTIASEVVLKSTDKIAEMAQISVCEAINADLADINAQLVNRVKALEARLAVKPAKRKHKKHRRRHSG